MLELGDTIAAVATSPGESGIGIIRISGDNALAAADAVFLPASGGKCSTVKTFTVHYGWVVSRRNGREELIDEALLTVMRRPRSYTKEDVVEISCHGGPAATRAVLEEVLENGCRLAEPGEFTKRAFLNGRIDLSRAEAVLDVIRAKTAPALRIGINQLRGELSRRLGQVREGLLDCLTRVEAAIDFPEDDSRILDRQGMRSRLQAESLRLERLLEGCCRGRVYREGLQAVICGKPNTGKSSLLNALLREERSIVTRVAGTTRDAIEETIDIRGIPLRIVDTAGMLAPRGLIEKKAINKTRERIDAADIIIAVFDGSRKLDARDALLMRRLADKKRRIAVVNKTDLKLRIEIARVRKSMGEPVLLSAKKGKNIAALEEAIVSAAGLAREGGEPVLVSNLRHIQQLKKIKKVVEDALKYRDNELPPECLAQSLKDALLLLDRLLGKSFSEDLLEKIFGEFCIGK